jgi:hypothetical protein
MTVIAVISFALFMFVYLKFLDPAFMQMLITEHGRNLNPYTSGLPLFIEGTFWGIIISFGLMQYLKESILPSVNEEKDEVMPANFSFQPR